MAKEGLVWIESQFCIEDGTPAKTENSQSVVLHSFNPSTEEVEASTSL